MVLANWPNKFAKVFREHKRNAFLLLAREEKLPVTENEEQRVWELGLYVVSQPSHSLLL